MPALPLDCDICKQCACKKRFPDPFPLDELTSPLQNIRPPDEKKTLDNEMSWWKLLLIAMIFIYGISAIGIGPQHS